eukprot:g80414.t1
MWSNFVGGAKDIDVARGIRIEESQDTQKQPGVVCRAAVICRAAAAPAARGGRTVRVVGRAIGACASAY